MLSESEQKARKNERKKEWAEGERDTRDRGVLIVEFCESSLPSEKPQGLHMQGITWSVSSNNKPPIILSNFSQS